MGIFIDNYLQGYDSFGFIQIVHGHALMKIVLFFFRVLQQGAWPLSQNNLSPLTIPVELEKTVSMYEKFYAKQFSGRKLTWLHHLSNGDIKLGFLPKTYIINMTTFQMSILLLFEKSDNLSYNELKATTKISDDQFPRHVQSLLEAKLLVCNTPVSNQSNT